MEHSKTTDEMRCNNCKLQLDRVRELEHLSGQHLFILEHPRRTLSVTYPVRLDSGEVIMVSGFRVQYNDALGPTKGGLRFHETVDEADVTELAFLMSLKTALLKLPYGGAKGGVKINPKEYSKGELERVARGYVREVYKIIGPYRDIPAPDVNTNPQIMAWMMDEYERLLGEKSPGVFTGKPLEIGGSLGRNESTARGAFFIIEEMFKKEKNLSNLTVAIQGFGNAGSKLAELLSKKGFTIVAVSDSKAALYNPKGLDIKALEKYKEENNSFDHYKEKGVKSITNEELLELDLDILVPAALGGVIHRSNVEKIKAKTIVEVANAPINADADRELEKKAKIIPDVLANAGGVVVSYFEWVQNLQNYYWSENEVNEKLKKHMLDAYLEVLKESKSQNIPLRTASYSLATKRILRAEELRGKL